MWRVEYAADSLRDFELIFDHLHGAYQDFGEDERTAFERAAERVHAIQAAGQEIAKAPYQGTLRPDILPGLRFVRRDGAVFWFNLDEAREVVQILAVFFGGQDHIRHMLRRLLEQGQR